MLKDLAVLAPFSLLADAAIVLGILVVLGDDVAAFSHHESVVLSKGLPAVPFLFGISIYCFEGIGLILPLEDAMENKKQARCCLRAAASATSV